MIHSFDGTAQDAEDYLNLGWMLSFNGMLTFKPKDYLREACRVVPDDRMLVKLTALSWRRCRCAKTL